MASSLITSCLVVCRFERSEGTIATFLSPWLLQTVLMKDNQTPSQAIALTAASLWDLGINGSISIGAADTVAGGGGGAASAGHCYGTPVVFGFGLAGGGTWIDSDSPVTTMTGRVLSVSCCADAVATWGHAAVYNRSVIERSNKCWEWWWCLWCYNNWGKWWRSLRMRNNRRYVLVVLASRSPPPQMVTLLSCRQRWLAAGGCTAQY